jgi:hypothetical protein
MKRLVFSCAVLTALLSNPILAEDRALLIGVGDYTHSSVPDLPGIDLDISIMEKNAKRMGFDAIKILRDEHATLNNVVHTMDDFLVKGVSADDRVLIYYSGHGTRIPDTNGDETEDQADEVLVMHDAELNTINGRPSVSGVLLDDDFNALLKKIPSRNVLILIDACNSGTMTKGLITESVLGDNLTTVSKFLSYPGMPLVSKGNFMPTQAQTSDNYVAISAAGDDEFAQATDKGSLFTLGLQLALNKAEKDKTPITPTELKNQADAFIQQENKRAPFTPRLTGNASLAQKAIKIRPSDQGHGDNWQRLQQLARQAEPLTLRINQKTYAEGEKLVITIDNQQSGYLNVINVGPKDEPTILFPNQYNPDAKISSDVSIPTPQMPFELTAMPPYGPSLVVAFFTEQPLNLYQSGDGSRDNKGAVEHLFHRLSELGLKELTRDFSVTAKSATLRAGSIETRVCPSACN